jgi:hypothetical protein
MILRFVEPGTPDHTLFLYENNRKLARSAEDFRVSRLPIIYVGGGVRDLHPSKGIE